MSRNSSKQKSTASNSIEKTRCVSYMFGNLEFKTLQTGASIK